MNRAEGWVSSIGELPHMCLTEQFLSYFQKKKLLLISTVSIIHFFIYTENSCTATYEETLKNIFVFEDIVFVLHACKCCISRPRINGSSPDLSNKKKKDMKPILAVLRLLQKRPVCVETMSYVDKIQNNNCTQFIYIIYFKHLK